MSALTATAGNWGQLLGYLGGPIVAALVTWWVAKRKTDVDESALILGKWKELVEQHQTDIRGIRDEFAAYKKSALEEFEAYKRTAIAEIGDLRTRLGKAEQRIVEQDREILALKEENAGLRRAIAQNSQSTAMLIGDPEKFTHNRRGK